MTRKRLDDVALILEQLNQRKIIGFEEEFRQLYDLVDHTVSTGGSNSVLVLGPRGVGKSLLVDCVLQKVKEKSKIFKDDGMVVRLSGLVETDDRLALREITKQLKLDNVVNNKVFGSFAQHLEFLLASLRSGESKVSKPSIFVLEEFELFTTHHNQTLLYNLFDVAQSRASPIIVIGISSHFDVVESLEKRVKSRFNHRQIPLMPSPDFDPYFKLVIRFLKHDSVSSDWTDAVTKLLDEHRVRKLFRTLHNLNNTVGRLKQFLTTALALLDPGNCLDYDHLEAVLTGQAEVTEKVVLSGLSILEMCVLVSINHLLKIYQDQPFNFEMAYHEYDKFATRRAKMFRYDRLVVMKAWEALLDLEIITPVDKGTKVQKEFKLCHLQVLPDLIMAVVDQNMPLSVKEWAVSVAIVD